MMQKPNPAKSILNLVVLATVIGFALTGWLAGHIIRFSTPELWHPPIEENNPGIKTGFEYEFEGIRRLVVIKEISQVPQVEVYPGDIQVNLLEKCGGNTYYTSMPAKCRSMDGRLVQVGGNQLDIFIIPFGEWGK